jgi:phosphopantothenoylcysteine decarboxylase/phosphopantothenate--cysteine ligase
VGWKYEVEGGRAGVIRLAEQQMADCRTDACVANGTAYGAGFGLVRRGGAVTHLRDAAALFAALEELIRRAG